MKKLWIIIGIVVLLLLIVFGVGYYLVFGFGSTPVLTGTGEKVIVKEITPGVISSYLDSKGFRELRNPCIETQVDGKSYFTQKSDGKTVTSEEACDSDIRITLNRDSALKLVNEGKTSGVGLEMLKSKVTLGLKGYLSLYERLSE